MAEVVSCSHSQYLEGLKARLAVLECDLATTKARGNLLQEELQLYQRLEYLVKEQLRLYQRLDQQQNIRMAAMEEIESLRAAAVANESPRMHRSVFLFALPILASLALAKHTLLGPYLGLGFDDLINGTVAELSSLRP